MEVKEGFVSLLSYPPHPAQAPSSDSPQLSEGAVWRHDGVGSQGLIAGGREVSPIPSPPFHPTPPEGTQHESPRCARLLSLLLPGGRPLPGQLRAPPSFIKHTKPKAEASRALRNVSP